MYIVQAYADENLQNRKLLKLCSKHKEQGKRHRRGMGGQLNIKL